MTADDTDETTSHEDEGTRSEAGGASAVGAEDAQRDDDNDDSDEERVKQRGEYDEDTVGVTDARPGRESISESQMPSDYHEAVKERPVEVKLPETPDLSEDAETESDKRSTKGSDKGSDKG